MTNVGGRPITVPITVVRAVSSVAAAAALSPDQSSQAGMVEPVKVAEVVTGIAANGTMPTAAQDRQPIHNVFVKNTTAPELGPVPVEASQKFSAAAAVFAQNNVRTKIKGGTFPNFCIHVFIKFKKIVLSPDTIPADSCGKRLPESEYNPCFRGSR